MDDSKRIVLEVPGYLTQDQRESIRQQCEQLFPWPAIVLEGGMKVGNLSEERLDRIEAKLDALHALLMDDEDEAQADSLDDASALTRPPATL